MTYGLLYPAFGSSIRSHSHFIDYYPHDFTDSQLKSDMDFIWLTFYKAYQDGWDKVQGGMRHGFAVESVFIPVNYPKTLEVSGIQSHTNTGY